jgi:queuosine precursor transporter
VIYVVVYLAAIIAANLSVATFGPTSVYVNAFLFIGLTLTTRDRLHEHWQGRHLTLKMGTIILTGGLASWLLNQDAGTIAIASVSAFIVAESVDTLVYHRLRHQPWVAKANGSNLFGALADSIVFPTIAFGSLMPVVVAGQFTAKVVGGFCWVLLIGWIVRSRISEAELPVAKA